MKRRGLQQVECVIDVCCDVCGKSCKKKVNGVDFKDYATITADWGYTSSHDGLRYQIHLCEHCFFSSLANLREARRGYRIFESESPDCEKDPLAEE